MIDQRLADALCKRIEEAVRSITDCP